MSQYDTPRGYKPPPTSPPPNFPPPGWLNSKSEPLHNPAASSSPLARYQAFAKKWPLGRIFRYFIIGAITMNSLKSYMKQREFFTVKPNTVLRWRWDKLGIVEAPKELDLRSGPSSLASRTMTLYDIIQALKDAKDDDRISGLVLDLATAGKQGVRTGSLGLAQAQEVREALLEFKEAKKQKFGQDAGCLIAYTDTFDSQLGYFVASVFDEIWMEPTGILPIYGLASAQPFFKNLLDKLGLHPRVFTREEYKSVLTMVDNTKYPEPVRRNLESMIHSLNGQFIQGIANGRLNWLKDADIYRVSMGMVVNQGKPKGIVEEQVNGEFDARTAFEKVRKVFDVAPLSAQESLAAGLVTAVKYRREMTDFFQHEARTPTIWGTVKQQKSINSMSLYRYKMAKDMELGRSKKARFGPRKDKVVVGLVYLTGGIARGDGPGGSNHVIRAVSEAGRDPEVSSIVLRIDSGGGDAIASDSLWESIKAVKDSTGKPVIASLGNMTASGGYYAAVACDKIIAMPGTITGSIGVASMRPWLSPEFLEKFGVTTDSIMTSKGAEAASLFNDLNASQVARYERKMDETYAIFKDRVAQGRNFTQSKVDAIAGGRVYTGEQALDIGLIDDYGGIHKAVDLALHTVLEKRLDLLPASIRENPDTIAATEKIKPQVRLFPAMKPWWQRLGDFEAIDEMMVYVGKSIYTQLEGRLAKEMRQELELSLDEDFAW